MVVFFRKGDEVEVMSSDMEFLMQVFALNFTNLGEMDFSNCELLISILKKSEFLMKQCGKIELWKNTESNKKINLLLNWYRKLTTQ